MKNTERKGEITHQMGTSWDTSRMDRAIEKWGYTDYCRLSILYYFVPFGGPMPHPIFTSDLNSSNIFWSSGENQNTQNPRLGAQRSYSSYGSPKRIKTIHSALYLVKLYLCCTKLCVSGIFLKSKPWDCAGSMKIHRSRNPSRRASNKSSSLCIYLGSI